MAAYIALVHKDAGTSYGVSFPDVPGCISAGDSFEQAVANAAEALAGHFAAMKADGDPLPAQLRDAQARPGFCRRRRRCHRDRGDAAHDGDGEVG